MKSKGTTHFREGGTAYIFNAPLVVVTAVFVLVPVVGTFIGSLFRDVTYLPVQFIAVDNYMRLFADPHFLHALRFTLLFVVCSVSAELVLGVIFALVLNESLPGRTMLRVAVLIPWAIPVAISARIWEWMYNYDFGFFNAVAAGSGILPDPVNWLGTPVSAFFSLVVTDVWKTTPFITVIVLAGLSAIDDELYQQATVDGARAVQRFRFVTLPLLRPVLIVALLFRTIDAIRIFDLVYVLTGGGPGGSTASISMYAYNYFATGDMGYGSAIAVTVFLVAALLSAMVIRAGGFRKEIE
ncbi:MAG: carbohydrate ABC transporter permease [Bacteroidota bacterium]